MVPVIYSRKSDSGEGPWDSGSLFCCGMAPRVFGLGSKPLEVSVRKPTWKGYMVPLAGAHSGSENRTVTCCLRCDFKAETFHFRSFASVFHWQGKYRYIFKVLPL